MSTDLKALANAPSASTFFKTTHIMKFHRTGREKMEKFIGTKWVSRGFFNNNTENQKINEFFKTLKENDFSLEFDLNNQV